ncbi:MAG TPA: M20/M25/M40 family metallo-hydrolase, partial [Fimbriimonadaceae bacterium]|nr:M20/M25/M40 family metallo-hydrolase [Fimbriimonadaceae bacterium]
MRTLSPAVAMLLCLAGCGSGEGLLVKSAGEAEKVNVETAPYTPVVTARASTAPPRAKRESVATHASSPRKAALVEVVEALCFREGTPVVRKAGSEQERAAAEWLIERLQDMGYSDAAQDPFDVPDLPGSSQNVLCLKQGSGTDRKLLVIGAHYDSKSPSPGANDNATGVAAVLEAARALKGIDLQHDVLFVFFGAEERVSAHRDHHHYGSRHHVGQIQTAGFLGMINVDIASGRTLRIGSMAGKTQIVGTAREEALSLGLKPVVGREGATSDHASYEARGLPAVYLHWWPTTGYHGLGDLPE